MSWSQLNAGATIPHEHATGCNSMQIPSSKQDTSWAPLGCSGETCSLSEETKSRTATASRASCHETRTTGESLPHFHRCVSSGGALPSTAVYVFDCYQQTFYLYEQWLFNRRKHDQCSSQQKALQYDKYSSQSKVLRVPSQNSISQACNIVEIYQSGLEPSIWSHD